METKDIVNGLFAGSQNIDRMKRETDFFAKMILGLIIEQGVSDNKLERRSGNICWILGRNRSTLSLSCNLRRGDVYDIVYSTFPNVYHRPEYARIVYEDGLVALVEAVMQWFPGIEKKWQFLLDAATE